jgi:hypothetical protein
MHAGYASGIGQLSRANVDHVLSPSDTMKVMGLAPIGKWIAFDISSARR